MTIAFSGGIWVSSSAILPLCMTKLCPYELQVPVLTSKSLYGSPYAVTTLHWHHLSCQIWQLRALEQLGLVLYLTLVSTRGFSATPSERCLLAYR